MAGRQDVCAMIQRDHERLEKWADRANAKSCTWGGTTPGITAHWELTRSLQGCKESPGCPGGQKVDYEPATCSHGKGSQQHAVLH